MITPRWILGFVGHRRVEDPGLAKKQLTEVILEIKAAVEKAGGQLEIHLSCAIGADLLCIDIAREHHIPIHLILPLAAKEFLNDFETDEERQRVEQEIALAKAGEHGSTFRVCRSNGIRPDCYYDMSQQILKHSDALLVYWNGAPARGLGGTAEIYALARQMGHPLAWIHSGTGEFVKEQWPESWPEPDPEMEALQDRDQQTTTSSPIQDIATLAKTLSARNKRHAPYFRKMTTVIIIVNAIAALLGSFAIMSAQVHGDSPKIGPAFWLSLNFSLVLLGSYLIHFLRKRAVYDHWVRGRVAAEIVRGVRATQPALDPLHPMVRDRAPEWARFALSAALMAHRERPNEDIETFRQRYMKERLEGQMDHFQTYGDQAIHFEKRLTRIGDMAALIAPFCIGIVFFNKLFRYLEWEWFWQKTILGAILVGLVPIIFPLISGTAASLNAAFDARRRGKRYPELAQQLARVKGEIKELRTEATLIEAVQQTEAALLNELLEWRSTVPHKAGYKKG